ncbi:MAG: alpha/beta hydrolase [Chloroherpetonaceae bacterium]|nr:alpha/beta hydrolase [Chloroherpetonaceae bacterium]MDW8019104.1 alpha/beta hydrolase [Chloroherpetonaceae bacterium]
MHSSRLLRVEEDAPELRRVPTLPNIRARMVQTTRLRTRVLFSGNQTGVPVIFIHGNLSSATWWEETMLRLPPQYYAIAPDLRGFGGADTAAVVDARRGVGDWVDDILALADALGIQRFHVVGNSLGGNVVWGLLLRCPERLLSVTLVAPGSPFGFGGTKDTLGTPCFPDYAGSGAGLANLLLLNAIKAGDRSLSTFSPRNALRNFVFKPGFIAPREEDLLSAMLTVHIGERALPGDKTPSPNFPGFAPGIYGPVNAISPKYAPSFKDFTRITPKPPILWIRGALDKAVSNRASSDAAVLGQAGLLPNYPGADICPPQPMIDQIRAVLRAYEQHSGFVREILLDDCAHAPHIEQPLLFDRYFHEHLLRAK